MLLLVRTLLIILFTSNTAGSADINLLIILITSFVLLMAHSNGTYKKWSYNYLESFFYLQLGVFAAAVAYDRFSITVIADTSFGLTLIVFLCVVAYHTIARINSIKNRYMKVENQDSEIVSHREHSEVEGQEEKYSEVEGQEDSEVRS